jgi:hypothetical protein
MSDGWCSTRLEFYVLWRRISFLRLDFRNVFYQTENGSKVWTMSKKSFKNKHQQQWEWEETPETKAAIAALHEGIRQRKLKDEDDKFNYDKTIKSTVKSSLISIFMLPKNLVKVLRQKTSLKLWSLLLLLL